MITIPSLLIICLLSCTGNIETCDSEIDTTTSLVHFTKKRGLKLFHQNVRGILSNFIHIEHLLDQCKNIDILSLSETHIKTYYNNDNLYKIQGYQFIQRSRDKGNGGGVAFYLKENLKWERRLDLETKTCENIWIEINI